MQKANTLNKEKCTIFKHFYPGTCKLKYYTIILRINGQMILNFYAKSKHVE